MDTHFADSRFLIQYKLLIYCILPETTVSLTLISNLFFNPEEPLYYSKVATTVWQSPFAPNPRLVLIQEITDVLLPFFAEIRTYRYPRQIAYRNDTYCTRTDS